MRFWGRRGLCSRQGVGINYKDLEEAFNAHVVGKEKPTHGIVGDSWKMTFEKEMEYKDQGFNPLPGTFGEEIMPDPNAGEETYASNKQATYQLKGGAGQPFTSGYLQAGPFGATQSINGPFAQGQYLGKTYPQHTLVILVDQVIGLMDEERLFEAAFKLGQLRNLLSEKGL